METNLRNIYPDIRRIDHYSEVLCGPFGTEITSKDYHNSGVPLLRITNITTEGTVDETDLVFINQDKSECLSTTQVRPKDLIISQRGTLGIPAVVPARYPVWNISANLIAIRNLKNFSSDFVQFFLSTRTGAFQLERAQSGQVQGKITTEDVASILIPLPPLPVQREMVSEMDAARESRRRKLAEAEALLSGLDAFLLERLGLIHPKKEYPHFFAAHRGDVLNRCDPDFHSPKFRELRQSIESCGHPVLAIDKICLSIKSGFAAGREVQAFDEIQGIPHIRPLNITQYGELHFDGTKYVPKNSIGVNEIIQKGEVLLNNTNSTQWVGKSTVFEYDRLCCCSNHINRLTINSSVALPWFIALFFNALRSTGYLGLLATNFVNQAGINVETIAALRIPIPDLSFQQEIIDELQHRRLKARQLRDEATIEWEAAKVRFEEKLLGKKV